MNPIDTIARIFVVTFVCSLLGACSPSVIPLPSTPLPVQATNRPATIEDIPTYPALPTDVPEIFLPHQPLMAPGPNPEKSQSLITATPAAQWNFGINEVYWDDYGVIRQPEWLNNNIVKLAVYNTGFSDGYINVDLSEGKSAKAKAASVHSDLKSYSPKRTYVIECGNVMQMYRANNHQLVNIVPGLSQLSTNKNCSRFFHWSPDESAASFIDANYNVYVWPSDGMGPRKVFEHIFSYSSIAWSPDSQKLVVEKSESDERISTVNVIDTSGRLLHEFQVQAGGDGFARLGWLTNQVLASYSRSTIWYYDSITGNFLFSWKSIPRGDGIVHQSPQVSPDGRWVFIDQGNEKRESIINPNHYIVRKEYSLYDIQSQKSIPLVDDWGNYLGYAGWNADASTLYLISRPAESVSNSNPATPFGLLGYNIQTHQYKQLFKDAFQVAWNADKSWAFVVFPEPDREGQLHIAGGLWEFGAETLIGQWQVSDRIVYQDPARDFSFSIFPAAIPIAWSHDNQYVSVSDHFGQVKLLGVDGSVELLLDEIPEINDDHVTLNWSPDDQHLLVSTRNRAWIVSMPDS